MRTAAERRDLRRIANLHGSRIVETAAIAGQTHHAAGLVVHDDPALADCAALYAHLTGRRALAVTNVDVDTLDDLDGAVEIMLCDWRALSFARLDAVWHYGIQRGPIGLIVGDRPAGIRREVLRRAAAAHLIAPPSDVSLVLPTFAMGGMKQAGLRLTGGMASSGTVAEALRDAAVVGLYAHGDGLDSRLAHRTTLCAVADLAAKRVRQAPPICVSNDWCHRLQVPVGEVAIDPDRIAADAIAAPILIAMTCFGVPAIGSTTPWRWSQVKSLLESGAIGTLVTPWGLCARMTGPLVALSHALAGGSSLGQALTRALQERDDDGGSARLVIFGDPRARSSAMPDAEASLAKLLGQLPRPPRSTIVPKNRHAGRIGTLRKLCELAGAPVPPGTPSPARRQHVLRALGAIKPYQCFARLAIATTCRPVPSDCHLCGNPVRILDQRLSGNQPDRVVHWCDRCGVTLDHEAGSDADRALPRLRGRSLILSWRFDTGALLIVEDLAALPPPTGAPAPERLLYTAEVTPGATVVRLPPWEGLRRWSVLAMRGDEIALFQGLA